MAKTVTDYGKNDYQYICYKQRGKGPETYRSYVFFSQKLAYQDVKHINVE